MSAIVGPDNILDTSNWEIGNRLLLLNIVQNNRLRSTQQKATSSAKVDVVDVKFRDLNRFCGGVGEVLDIDLLGGLVENGESVSGDEDGRVARSSLGVGRLDRSRSVAREVDEFVDSAIRRRGDQNSTLSRVV